MHKYVYFLFPIDKCKPTILKSVIPILLFTFPYGSFFSNFKQIYSREMKYRKAHLVVKYLKLKRSDPSIELRELAC